METKQYLLGNLAEIGRGSSPRPITDEAYFKDGNIPWIKIADATASDKYIYETKEHVNEYGASFSRKLKPGTLIIAASGTLGFPKFLGIEGCIHDGWMYFSDFDENVIDREYLYYYLITLRGYFNNLSYGAAIQNINTPIVKKTKVQLPSLPTQQKIASILSAYDNLIQNYKKQIEDLQTTASELYKEWFVRFRFPGYKTAQFENGIPVGWKYESLNEIANVTMGQSPESCFYNDEQKGLPFHQGAGSYGELYLIDDVYSTEGLRIAEPGSIIFSVRAPVGKLNITLNKIILGRGVAAINSKENANGFLFWSLKSKFSKEDLIGNGAVFASVTKDELLKQKFLIPSKDILLKYERIANDIEKRMRSLYQQITNLTKQRDLLLPRLMSGKLEILC